MPNFIVYQTIYNFRTVRIDSMPFPYPHKACRFGDFGNLELLSLLNISLWMEMVQMRGWLPVFFASN